MKQLTNKQLAELREKWVFYCDYYTQELYKAGLDPSETLMDGAEENELVLKLIENAIEDKALPKKTARSKYHQQYYQKNRKRLNEMNAEYSRKVRADALAYRKLREEILAYRKLQEEIWQ